MGWVVLLAQTAAEPHWFWESWLVTVSGVCVVLTIIALCWVFRELVGVVVTTVLMLACAVLLLAALAGQPLGIYGALQRWFAASP